MLRRGPGADPRVHLGGSELVHHRDLPGAAPALVGMLAILGAPGKRSHVGVGLLADPVLQVVPPSLGVDQAPGTGGAGAHPHVVVHHRIVRVGGEIPTRRDVRPPRLVDDVDEAAELLAIGVGHVLARVALERGLVGEDPPLLRPDPDLLQEPLHVGAVGGETGDEQVPLGIELHPVRHRGHVVQALPHAVAVDVDRLPRGAERGQLAPQLPRHRGTDHGAGEVEGHPGGGGFLEDAIQGGEEIGPGHATLVEPPALAVGDPLVLQAHRDDPLRLAQGAEGAGQGNPAMGRVHAQEDGRGHVVPVGIVLGKGMEPDVVEGHSEVHPEGDVAVEAAGGGAHVETVDRTNLEAGAPRGIAQRLAPGPGGITVQGEHGSSEGPDAHVDHAPPDGEEVVDHHRTAVGEPGGGATDHAEHETVVAPQGIGGVPREPLPGEPHGGEVVASGETELGGAERGRAGARHRHRAAGEPDVPSHGHAPVVDGTGTEIAFVPGDGELGGGGGAPGGGVEERAGRAPGDRGGLGEEGRVELIGVVGNTLAAGDGDEEGGNEEREEPSTGTHAGLRKRPVAVFTVLVPLPVPSGKVSSGWRRPGAG